MRIGNTHIQAGLCEAGQAFAWRTSSYRVCGPRRLAAFSLVEVLVASVLLGLGVAGLMSAATLSMRNQRRIDQRSAALYLAQEKLAEIELKGAHVWSLGYPTRGMEERGEIAYEWSITIEQLSVGELFRVNVDVQWSAASGSGAVELETLLNDYQAATLTPTEQQNQMNPTAANLQPVK